MAGWKFFLDDIEVEEPIGWDSIEFTAIRQNDHGVDQPFSTEITFYEKGARYLKKRFEENFTGAEVKLKIVGSQPTNANYEYNGYVDFATYEEINSCDTDSWSITVAIVQDAFREKIKSRFDVEVDIIAPTDLDNTPIEDGSLLFENILMHGQRLALLGSGGSTANSADIGIGKQSTAWNPTQYRAVLPIYWDDSDFEGIFGNTTDVSGYTWSATNVIFQDNSGGTIQREMRFSWQAFNYNVRFWDYNLQYPADCINLGFPAAPNACYPANWTSGVKLLLTTLNSSGGGVQTYVLHASPAIAWDYNNTGTFTAVNIPAGFVDIQVPVGGRVSVYFEWASDIGVIRVGVGQGVQYNGGVGTNGQPYKFGGFLRLFDNISATLTETNTSYASINKGIPIERFIRRIIHKITGQNNRLVSDIFSEAGDGGYANHIITNGLLLRKFVPPSGQKIQVRSSFKKTMESLSAIFNVGWGFELQSNGEYAIRVEPFDYFYKNEISDVFTDVAELKQTPVAEKMYNQLKLGFSDNWRNKALGGTDALSVDRVYYLNNNAVKNGSTSTLEKFSEFICEGVAIEYSRRLQFYDPEAGSSDRPNDYNNFVVWTVREDIVVNTDTLQEYKTSAAVSGNINLTKYRASWSSLLFGTLQMAGDNLRRYNLFHTSTRVAFRHWQLLGMNVFKLADPKWFFQVGQYRTLFFSAVNKDKQPLLAEITGFNNTILLAEDTNVEPDGVNIKFRTPTLKPIIYEFSYPQSFCEFIELATINQYKKIVATIGKVVIEGFILEIKNKPEDNSGGTTSFKIIGSQLSSYVEEQPAPEPQSPYNDAYNDAYL